MSILEAFDRIDAFGKAYAAFVIRRPVTALAAGLLLAAACLTGLPLLTVNNDYRSFVGEHNFALDAADWISERQGDKGEIVTLIYVPGSGDVLDPLSLVQYIQAAEFSKGFAYVRRSRSWTDLEKLVKLEGASNEARAAPILYDADVFASQSREIFREDLKATQVILGRYISKKLDSALIFLFIDEDTEISKTDKIKSIQAEVSDLEGRLRQISADDQLILAGAGLFENAAQEVLRSDLRKIFPAVAIATLLFFYICFRSLAFLGVAVVVIFVPIISTAGLISHFGLSFSNLSISGLLLVGSLAVADVLHIANSHYLALAQGDAKAEAVNDAIAKNFRAVFATSLTTALGQIALIFSASPPIQVMGWTIIVGVWISMVLALTILPWALLRLPRAKTALLNRVSEALARASLVAYRAPRVCVTVVLLLVLGSGLALTTARVSDSMKGWFAKDVDFHRAMSLFDEGYLGANTVSFALPMDANDGIAARNWPEANPVFDYYSSVRERLGQVTETGNWLTPVDAVHATRERIESAPDITTLVVAPDPGLKRFSAEVVAKSGLTTRFEMGKQDYTFWYYDSAHVSSFEVVRATEIVQAAFQEAAGEREVRHGGVGLAISLLSVNNFWNVVRSSIEVFILISIVMILVSGSFRYGLVSIVPNIIPMGVVFGAWSAFGNTLNLAAVTVFSVAIGIVVDDTIHIITKFRRNIKDGLSNEGAVYSTIRNTGTALLCTTIFLSIGFFSLATSSFQLTSEKSLLVGFVIVVALVFDLFLLPLLLVLCSYRRSS